MLSPYIGISNITKFEPETWLVIDSLPRPGLLRTMNSLPVFTKRLKVKLNEINDAVQRSNIVIECVVSLSTKTKTVERNRAEEMFTL